MSISNKQRMQEYLHQTADAGDFLSESGSIILSIRQRMQESLYQTADAGDTLLDSGCRSYSIRQRMQETVYQTAVAGESQSDSIRCPMECLLHLLSDSESSASDV